MLQTGARGVDDLVNYMGWSFPGRCWGTTVILGSEPYSCLDGQTARMTHVFGLGTMPYLPRTGHDHENVSPGAVRVAQHRALGRLRELAAHEIRTGELGALGPGQSRSQYDG